MDNKAQARADEQYAQQLAAQQQAEAAQAQAQSTQDVEQMKAQLQQLQAQQAAAAMPAASSTDILGQLERLAQLKTSGVLSEAEFDVAKAKLLAA